MLFPRPKRPLTVVLQWCYRGVTTTPAKKIQKTKIRKLLKGKGEDLRVIDTHDDPKYP
jgi:hypothetical protein